MPKSPFSGPKSFREFKGEQTPGSGDGNGNQDGIKNIMIISKYDTVVSLRKVYVAVAHSSLFFYSDRIRRGAQMQ